MVNPLGRDLLGVIEAERRRGVRGIHSQRISRRAELRRARGVAILAGARRRHLARLVRVADPLIVPAGRQLARQGDPARQFVLILEGSFEATNGSGARVLRTGDHFGLDELVAGAPSDETVTALTASEVLVLGRRETLGLMFAVPRLAGRMLEGCAARRRPWPAFVR